MTTQIKQKTVGIPSNLWYSIKALECLAQLGEHFLDVEGVMGSSPLALTVETASACGFFIYFHIRITNTSSSFGSFRNSIKKVIPITYGYDRVTYECMSRPVWHVI